MAQEKIVQTAGRTQLGEFAPEFAHLNDDILFGEVWSRNDLLSLRDRSLVTLTSLISQGITDSSLTYHLQEARKNGITRTEIAEIITHIAFYAGWPKAWAAFRQAKDVWAEETSADDAKARFQQEMIFPIGEPNTAYAKYFTGTVTWHVFPMSRFPLPTSPLNQDVATTGTSIMPPKAEVKCLSVWLVVAGIRRRESLRRRFFRERSSTSRQA